MCGLCEADADEAEALDTALWGQVLAPVVLLGLSGMLVMSGCVPVFGLFLSPIGGLVAVGAVVAGVRNFFVADVEGPQRTALVVAGALGLFGGLLLVPLSGLFLLAALSAL